MRFYLRPPQLPDLPEIDPEKREELKESGYTNKYIQKYRLAEENNAKKMSDEIADKNRAKRRKFFFKFLDAIAIALITLAVEHGVPMMINLFHGLFS